MTGEDSIPLLTLLTSLVPAAIIFLLPEQRVAIRTVVNMAGATLKLVLIAWMLWGVFHQHRYAFRFPVLPDLDFVLRADALAMFFVTLSGLLWFLTTIYAISYLEGSPHRSRFFGFFSLCVSATIGIALAGNLFTFVLFYELLTLSTYPLVVHRETDVSRRAGQVYLFYTLGGGALVLLGAGWLHALVPVVEFNGGTSLAALGANHDTTLRMIFFLLMAGVGVKAALVPLHGWLPRAMVAPAPVSALLHAVAVVKAGAFAIVRVVYDVYGVDRASALGVLLPVAIWASVTIVYGSVRALFQDDLKRRLAFSTVSQVSYIALGVALFGPSSTVGGVVHLVHQGLMKITLFFCAGNLAETLGIKSVSQMGGVARRMPWTMAAFTVGAFGMIGVPPLCGFISKWYLGSGAVEAAQFWVLAVLAASSALNAAYFLPIVYAAWFGRDGDDRTDRGGTEEAAWGLLAPPLVTAALAIGVGLMASTPFSPLQWAVLIVERAYGRVVVDRGLGGGLGVQGGDRLLLLMAIAAPLAAAIALLFGGPGRAARWLVALAAVPALVLAWFAMPGSRVDLPWLLLHMHLGIDLTGQTFLFFTAPPWLLAGVYALGYLANDARAGRFFVCFLLAMTGNFGLILSQDMASFYLFFALMSFASYPLVIHFGDPEALRAGRVYMVLVLVGEVALLTGILLLAVARGSLLFESSAGSFASAPTAPLIVSLILIGFGIKAGVVPLHVWLPLAHPAAPTPASAVLSGAMIKAGLLGWLRFLPVGEGAAPMWGELCLVVGLVTAFYGVVVGVTQSNAKTVLAYSSISQMGLMTLGVGGGLLVPTVWPGALQAVLVYALHHGLSKGCLFLSVGVAPWTAGKAWHQRLLQLGLLLPALSLAGAPLTIGAVSKAALKYSLDSLPPAWPLMMNVLLPLASVGTTLLMARFLYLVWPRSESDAEHPTASMLVAWFGLLFTVVAAAWMLPTGIAAEPGTGLLIQTMTWANLWPVVVGTAVAWIAWRVGSGRESAILPAIPAGDMLVIWRRLQLPLARLRIPVVNSLEQPNFPSIKRLARLIDLRYGREFILSAESLMERWPWVAGSLATLAGACYLSWLLFA